MVSWETSEIPAGASHCISHPPKEKIFILRYLMASFMVSRSIVLKITSISMVPSAKGLDVLL